MVLNAKQAINDLIYNKTNIEIRRILNNIHWGKLLKWNYKDNKNISRL